VVPDLDLSMTSPRGVGRIARAVRAAATNAAEVARFGGLRTGEEASPFQVVARTPMFRLRRYFPAEPVGRPVLLIPPLMMTAEVYDVSAATSGVGILHCRGVDPWVIDFGAPEREEGGLGRNVADHVLAVSEAVDLVRERTGADVHLSGYSQGGMFAYQVAAYRRAAGLAGLITFGSPVDSRTTRVFGAASEDVMVGALSTIADHVLVHVHVPAWANRLGFRLLDPAKSVRARVEFLRRLHDREALLSREKQRQFLERDGYVAYPGPAIAELVKQFVAHNRMLAGGISVGDVVAALADITCPVLAFFGTVDTIAPPASVLAIGRAAPDAEVFCCPVPTGHFGLVVGGNATTRTWPTVAAWVNREGTAPPEDVQPWEDVAPAPSLPQPIGAGLERGAAAVSAARSAGGAALGGLRLGVELGLGVLAALPGAAGRRGDPRASMAALLAERARRSPDDVFFVFEGRGHTYASAQARIDAVVGGLLAAGVRQGEHIGVLMDTRPSALSAVAALNRIGAVAALLRPDGDWDRETKLARVVRIIADPRHAAAAATLGPPVCVLGSRTPGWRPPTGSVDLEAVDPAALDPPAWYRPNAAEAADPAFLLFAGQGAGTRMTTIGNGQWTRAAFASAAAARLRAPDTVYGVTPLHHPSGLLTAVGGALGGGARLALTARFEPPTFWAEVRRYGVTAACYTWTQLHDLIEAEPATAEQHHQLRLFMGSGMPSWLAQRARDRFPRVEVLELFAHAPSGLMLAGVDPDKPGAKGRALPGSAPARLVRYDPVAGRPVTNEHGLAVECAVGESGLLVAEAAADDGSAVPLRGLFSPGDRWASTEHLFHRDGDGDYWLVAHVADLVRTGLGMATPSRAEEALGSLAAVDLVTCFGTPGAAGEPGRLVAALTVRPGRDLSTARIEAALSGLSLVDRPEVVRLLTDMPMTTWWRPDHAVLRRDHPAAAVGWVRTPAGSYRPMPAGARSAGKVLIDP